MVNHVVAGSTRDVEPRAIEEYVCVQQYIVYTNRGGGDLSKQQENVAILHFSL